jgi:hypothetical protein
MAIPERCDRILALLIRLKRYDTMVRQDTFTNSARGEMKQNCKDLIKDAKGELDEIKSEVNSW